MAPAPLVTPFFPAHSLLPSLSNFVAQLPPLTSPSALRSWYTSASTDPLHPALLFCAGLSGVVWLLGEITDNVSQVDRLWAALPLVYSVHFALWPKISGAAGGVLNDRMLLVLGLQVLWSLRLHTNTYRRGFFNPKSEDYRWLIVREKIPKWLFKIFAFVFIAIIQNILLLVVELPQYLLLTLHLAEKPASPSVAASIIPSTPKTIPSGFLNPSLNIADYLLAAVFVTILILEMLGDNQQQRYQALKARAVAKGNKGEQLSDKEQAAVSRGFVTGGLWSWSRHPNFACEQSTWWILYLFTLLPFVYASYTSHTHSSILASASSHLPSAKVASHYLTHLPQHLGTYIEKMPYLPTSLSDVSALAHSALESVPDKHTLVAAAKEAYATVRKDEGLFWNYSIWGPISMSALFYASTDLTEKISAGKYPLYKQYQKRVGMFWPPLTIVKGLWLAVTGRRGKVDRAVWGIPGGQKMKKL